MEALAHDLTLALEESNKNTSARRRWNIRRRTSSAGNIPSSVMNKISEDSSSSVCDIHFHKHRETSTMTLKYESDSDDTNNSKRIATFPNVNNISNVESDSMNEHFIPRVITRRKRKFKKMAIDSDSNPSLSQTSTNIVNIFGKKKKYLRNYCESKYGTAWCGKRKRSCRERSTDCERNQQLLRPIRYVKNRNKNKTQNDDAMDCTRISSSSISSSDSDNGLNTNDEDQEGDDEQSDWIGDSSWCEDLENARDNKCLNFSMQSSIYKKFENLSEESKKCHRQKVQSIRDGLSGREILAGRRHVDNTPGYSIITSANEKVSRFLQDPYQKELKLHPIRQFEREKLRRLANLYNLNLKGDISCPILHKTKYTTQAVCIDQVSFNRFSDNKRLRKTPPGSPNPD